MKNNLFENISPHTRRRINLDGLKQDVDILVDYELNPCDFYSSGDFVAEVCDILTYQYLEELQVSSKDKDNFYFYLVDLFGKYLVNIYIKECGKNLNESKKQIIITESQYNRLFEQKISKKDIFQDLINNKLQDIKNSCDSEDDYGYDICEQTDIIESIDVVNVESSNRNRINMDGIPYQTTTSTIIIEIIINYNSIVNTYDFDDLIYSIKYDIRKSTGLPIHLDYKTNNIKTISE